MSAIRVLHERKAHCLEGAFFACACLKLNGQKPLLVNLKARKPDIDHALAIFRKNGYYGAISKGGHAVLTYRDPVYRSVRELVMSFFHEYFLFTNGTKMLIGYSKPLNLDRFGRKWMIGGEDLWDVAEKIYNLPVIPVVPRKNTRHLRAVPKRERRVLNTLV